MTKWHSHHGAQDFVGSDENFGNSPLQFYKNRHGQYELFPPVTMWGKMRYRWRLVTMSLVVILAIGMTLGASLSEEVPVQKSYGVLSGGLICDSQEQVHAFLAEGGKNPNGTIPVVEGCGFLQGQIIALWEPIEVYEDEMATAIIIRLESPQVGVQYSYLGYKAKPKGTTV